MNHEGDGSGPLGLGFPSGSRGREIAIAVVGVVGVVGVGVVVVGVVVVGVGGDGRGAESGLEESASGLLASSPIKKTKCPSNK